MELSHHATASICLLGESSKFEPFPEIVSSLIQILKDGRKEK